MRGLPSFFILNADGSPHTIMLPKYERKSWYRVIDTSLQSGEDFLSPEKEVILNPSDHYQANPRSINVLLGKQ